MHRIIYVAAALAAVLIPASTCVGLQGIGASADGNWKAMHDEGIAALERGDRETAQRALAASMAAADAAGVPHEYFEHSMMRLGRVKQRAGQFAEAEKQYREALMVREAALGPHHLRIAELLADLATVCAAQGEYGEATNLTRRLVAIQETHLGEEHLDVGISLFRLATYAVALGDCAEAEALLKRSLPITNGRLGNKVTLTDSLESFAAVQLADRQYHVAETLYRRALTLRSVATADSDVRVQSLLTTLGFMNEQRGRWSTAETDYDRAFRASRSDLIATRLWHVRARSGRRDAADDELGRHFALRSAGANPWATQLIRYLLGQIDDVTLLESAVTDDPVAEASNLCDAFYLIGAVQLLDGNTEQASAAFEACRATDVQSALAFRSAVAGLEQIDEQIRITSVDEGAAFGE